jgi:hypothetical protein
MHRLAVTLQVVAIKPLQAREKGERRPPLRTDRHIVFGMVQRRKPSTAQGFLLATYIQSLLLIGFLGQGDMDHSKLASRDVASLALFCYG